MHFAKYATHLGFCLGLSAAMTTVAAAQEITLTANEGGAVLRGTLVSFDETHYTIRTAMGELRAPIERVTCQGEDCPVIKPPAAELFISGAGGLAKDLMPVLLNAHASALNSKIAGDGSNNEPLFTISDNEGDDIALVTVRETTSTAAISDLLQSDATLALTTRPVGQREFEAFAGSGLGDLRDGNQETVVALDGMVILVSPANPVKALSQRDAALIFSGNVTNWSEVGGPDAPIRLYMKDLESDAAGYFSRVVMRPHGVDLLPEIETYASDEEVARAVAGDALGIGISSFANSGRARPISITDVCGLISSPSAFAIKTEEYPLTRRLYAYRTNEQSPQYVDKLLEFSASDAAQTAIARAGFVDQKVTQIRISDQGMRFAAAISGVEDQDGLARLQQVVSELVGSERLSTTFRFDAEGTDLDSRGSGDLTRLADRLSEEGGARKTVRIFGFTDSVGDPAQNLELSQARANEVRDELLSLRPELADKFDFRAIGFGNTSPLACNDTAEGRFVNRRVEVWIGAS